MNTENYKENLVKTGAAKWVKSTDLKHGRVFLQVYAIGEFVIRHEIKTVTLTDQGVGFRLEELNGRKAGRLNRSETGNDWFIATHVEDVSPEEMQKRMAD